MAKTLVIVESPAKAKSISKFLSKNYTVKASMGHLRDLPKSQMGVDIENDFEPKYISIRGRGEIIKELRAAAKSANRVLLASDPDREGEAIAWHLCHLLGLDLTSKCRVEFNEITKNAVTAAIKEPREIDNNKVDAQQARRVLDRLVGYQLSPLLWRKVKGGLSAGRVQSVAVRLIVEREREIEAFVPVASYRVDAEFTTVEGNKFKAKIAGNFKTKEEAVDFINKNIDASYQIADLTKKPASKSPAPP